METDSAHLLCVTPFISSGQRACVQMEHGRGGVLLLESRPIHGPLDNPGSRSLSLSLSLPLGTVWPHINVDEQSVKGSEQTSRGGAPCE